MDANGRISGSKGLVVEVTLEQPLEGRRGRSGLAGVLLRA